MTLFWLRMKYKWKKHCVAACIRSTQDYITIQERYNRESKIKLERGTSANKQAEHYIKRGKKYLAEKKEMGALIYTLEIKRAEDGRKRRGKE